MDKTTISAAAPSAFVDATPRVGPSGRGRLAGVSRTPAIDEAGESAARPDMVDQQSDDSFPASDPPSWAGLRV